MAQRKRVGCAGIGAMSDPFIARQSTLKALSVCGRRTYHDLLAGEDSIRGHTEATAELGTVQHAVCAAILRTLYEQGETEMSTYEAEAIANEVYATSSIVLPPREYDDLIWMTLRFVERPKRVDRLLPTENGPAIEQRIQVSIRCSDDVTRILSCQPDAIFVADDSTTLIVPDWKSGRAKPRQPRQPQEGVPEDTAVGYDFLSPSGHFQGPAYLLAAFHKMPRAKRGVFREFYLRYGLFREFVMDRGSDKHQRFEAYIAAQLMKLERGLSEGENSKVWRPRPGAHCAKACPVARSCPIPEEQRGVGAIEDDESADREAGRFVMIEGLRNQLRIALKVRYQATGRPHVVGDGTQLAWNGGAGDAFQVLREETGNGVQEPEEARA